MNTFKTNLRRVASGALMYACNHVVNRIPLHSWRIHIYQKIYGFDLDHGSTILLGVKFYGSKRFSLGKGSVINDGCRLDNRAGITIGNSVSLSSEVAVITADHNVQDSAFEPSLRSVSIGDFVYVGIRATILPGVTIGTGAVVAASSLVTADIPPFSIVAGNPAKIIGWRSKDLSYTLDYRPYFQ